MKRAITLIAVVCAALGAGCRTRLTGNEGNLVFSYWSDDDVTNFNKPIAVGAWLDLKVAKVGGGRVEVAAASFDDAAILDVAGTSGNLITVMGVGDGGALLQVDAVTPDGEALHDSVNLLARTPEVIKLGHTCTLDERAAYLVDQEVWLSYEMEMANGQPVIGYGYYPLSFDAQGPSLDADASGSWWVTVQTGSQTGAAALRSEIGDAERVLEIRRPWDVDGVQEPIAGVVEDIDVGDVNPFYVRPMVGDLVVCQGDLRKEVTPLTPEICDVRDAEAPSDADEAARAEHGWFEIEGVAEGTCEYEVRFPDAAGGLGVAGVFSYAIEP